MQNRVICDKATLECKRKNCRVARLHDPQPNWQNIKFTCKDINSRYKAKEECSYKEIEWKELRDYQRKLAYQGAVILNTKGFVYFAFEPRVGKTYTAFEAAGLAGIKKLYFITTANALPHIINDWDSLLNKPDCEVEMFNFDMLHKYLHIAKDNDNTTAIIVDEAHYNGAYPITNLQTDQLIQITKGKRVMFMSGTPTPEGFSQIFHQLKITKYSPFPHANFYKWAKEFVNVTKEKRFGIEVNNYDDAKEEEIKAIIKPYIMSYTRKEAGFKYEITERIKEVEMMPQTNQLIKLLLKRKVYDFSAFKGEIISDSIVKLMDHVHQISSGTIKTEDGEYHILDKSKAKYIKENYQGQKIAIMYKYIAEGELLKEFFPNWTKNDIEFNLSNDRVYLAQVASAAEGTNISTADVLIMYNIDYSAKLYYQACNRIQTWDRKTEPFVDWLFNKDSNIERLIYEKLSNKMNYTATYFKKDMKTLN